MTTSAPARATRREWIGLAVIALPTLFFSRSTSSVLYLALPQSASSSAPSAREQLWIIDIYSFLVAGFLVTMGNLGDRIGRRRLLMIGAAAFSVASVRRGLLDRAGDADRGPRAARRGRRDADAVDDGADPQHVPRPHQRGVAIGVWFSCFMGGMVLGPLVGGMVLEHFWWGSAFLLGVPVMVRAPDRRPAVPARVPGRERPPHRPRQRRAVAGRGAAGDLGNQGDRPRRVGGRAGRGRRGRGGAGVSCSYGGRVG